MIKCLMFEIGQEIEITVNDKKTKAYIFGYELKYPEWEYHVRIPEFEFDLPIKQEDLLKGANIVTNGCAAKVLSREKVKTK